MLGKSKNIFFLMVIYLKQIQETWGLSGWRRKCDHFSGWWELVNIELFSFRVHRKHTHIGVSLKMEPFTHHWVPTRTLIIPWQITLICMCIYIYILCILYWLSCQKVMFAGCILMFIPSHFMCVKKTTNHFIMLWEGNLFKSFICAIHNFRSSTRDTLG